MHDKPIADARYDAVPDLHFVTDARGRILVGSNPFTPRGSLSGEHLGELVAVVRIRKNGATHFGYLESRVFNLAYWRGERELANAHAADRDARANVPATRGAQAVIGG